MKKQFLVYGLLGLVIVGLFLWGLNSQLELSKINADNSKNEDVVIETSLVLEEELNTLKQYVNNETIPVETFKENASKYSASITFLQRFFNDEIVYVGVDGITFTPVDLSLNMNKLNFELIERDDDGYLVYPNSLRGIDISKHQGDIDFDKVKADDIDYAILRVGYRGYGNGALNVDEMFHEYAQGAMDSGLQIGGYFFSQAITVEEAIEEALLVIENIEDYDITYPIVFDMEEITEGTARTKDLTTQENTDIALAFMKTIEDAGYDAMIYGNIKWFMEKVDMQQLEDYPKWFAQYYQLPFFPYALDMWQYTASGRVDGVTGNCDINISFTDRWHIADEEEETDSE